MKINTNPDSFTIPVESSPCSFREAPTNSQNTEHSGLPKAAANGAVILLLTTILVALSSSWTLLGAGEFVEFRLPLREGKYYSLLDFCRESNRVLRTEHRLETITERQLEIGGAERAALLLAQQWQLLRISFHNDHLLIYIPDPEDDAARLEKRKRLERLFGVSIPEWPPDKGLRIPEDFNPALRTVLLIHGLQSGPHDLARMHQALEKQGFQVLYFDYPNDGPLAWSGDHLSSELKTLSTNHPGMCVILVAHSMGGLVARYCLETPDKNPGCVTDLFLLGTPNQGSALAGMQDWLELVCEAIPGKLRPSATWSGGLGEAAVDLQTNSRFLTELNARSRAPEVRYHVAVGTRGFMAEDNHASVRAALLDALRRRDLSLAKQGLVLKVLDSDELRTGRGDGAVTIQSALLFDATSTRHFDLNHIELRSLSGNHPEEHEVFRWIMHNLE